MPLGEAGGDGQYAPPVVAVRSRCAARVDFDGWARERRLLQWVEAAMERAVTTLFGKKSLRWQLRELESILAVVAEVRERVSWERSANHPWEIPMNVLVALLIAGVFLLDVIFFVIFALSWGNRKRRPPTQRKSPKRNKKLFHTVFLIFIVGWSAATLSIDAKIVHGALRQTQARQYPSVEGKVIHCKVEERSDSDGTVYDVDILYSYEVQQKQFTCNRVRFLKLWGKEWVVPFAEAHRAGSKVTVYYNPDDPGDAVLLPGVAGQELFAPLFAIPFNVVMIGLWFFLFFFLFFGKPTYFRLWDRGDEVRVRLGFHPILGGFLFFIFGPLPLSFFLFCCAGMPPSVEAVAIAWVLYLGSSALLFLILARRAASGERDLVIDRLRSTLTLPRVSAQNEPIVIPLGTVLAVDVSQEQKQGSDGASDIYIPVLRWRSVNGDLQDARLAEWDDEEEAHRLAEWLRTAVGIATLPEE